MSSSGGPGGREQPKITIEGALDSADIDRFYGFYVAAFQPVRTLAAARHMLTAEEFVAWRDGRAVGLTTLTTDIAAVPWIEPTYYTTRYPEQAARGALFYLGFTLVDPDAGTLGVFKSMMDTVCRRFAAAQGACAFDFCDHNANGAVGRIVRALPKSFGAPVEEVDTQRYYVADFSGSPAPSRSA
jgi:hypothetical protein